MTDRLPGELAGRLDDRAQALLGLGALTQIRMVSRCL